MGYISIFLFFMAPLVVIVITSFDQTGNFVFPPTEWSFVWYFEYMESITWQRATRSSLITATGTMILSTILGVAAAFGVRELGAKASNYFVALLITPLLLPPVVTGVMLLTFLGNFGLHQTYIGIIIAHTLWSTPIIFFMMQAVLSRFDWETYAAARDLGADVLQSFVEVIFPPIKAGIIASALIGFVISLQEFIMALFLSGFHTRTIPVLAWSQLREALDPITGVISAMLILSVIMLLLVVYVSIGLERFSRSI